jgi:hypothetical protein
LLIRYLAEIAVDSGQQIMSSEIPTVVLFSTSIGFDLWGVWRDRTTHRGQDDWSDYSKCNSFDPALGDPLSPAGAEVNCQMSGRLKAKTVAAYALRLAGRKTQTRVASDYSAAIFVNRHAILTPYRG